MIKKRKILSITGTRSDYGLMTPVFKKIRDSENLYLSLVITGMHLLNDFKSSLEIICNDHFGDLYTASMLLSEDSGKAMAQSLGLGIFSISSIIAEVKPDIVLLQGDRGEMLAGAISSAHMNIATVHMSGGDFSGSIDDSIRNAISKFSHIHLTTCSQSTKRLLNMGERNNRIFEVGEPGIDLIKDMEFLPPEKIAAELNLDINKSIIIMAQHPVTNESEYSAWQIIQTLEALSELKIQTVITYPNSDTGSKEMIKTLESYRGCEFFKIIPNLGSKKYLSLLKISSVIVGNSSSGIFEAPSFRIPAVNIGTRQYGRLKANNVIDVGYDKDEIKTAILYCLENQDFKNSLKNCINPYGDGNTAAKTIRILTELRLIPQLLTKWINFDEKFN